MNTKAYRILRYRDFPCLLCLVCGRVSHHRTDIEQKYCGRCNLFLDDLPVDYPGPQTDGRSPGLLLKGAPPAGRTVTLTEEERQVVVLALEHLGIERPGWQYMLGLLRAKLTGTAPTEEDLHRWAKSAGLEAPGGEVAS